MRSVLLIFTTVLVTAGCGHMTDKPSKNQEVWNVDNLEKIGGHTVEVVGEPEVIETSNGKALEFDGVDDAVFLDVHPLAGWKEFTVEVIFKPYREGKEEQRFFHMQVNESEDRVMFETRLTDDRRWFLDTFIKSDGNSCVLYAEDFKHSVGPWYHAAIVFDGRTVKHYVNGHLELSEKFEYSPQHEGRTSLGTRINERSWYKGAIRKIRFTDGVLQPADFLRQF